MLSRVFEWHERLTRWNDDILNKFLTDVYDCSHPHGEGYLAEKRQVLKQRPSYWIERLDLANQARLTAMFNQYNAEEWLQTYYDTKEVQA
tara:strand:- start:292 stop:561 length:270 start_codon:yes stop_codon:yes gene_type:complete